MTDINIDDSHYLLMNETRRTALEELFLGPRRNQNRRIAVVRTAEGGLASGEAGATGGARTPRRSAVALTVAAASLGSA